MNTLLQLPFPRVCSPKDDLSPPRSPANEFSPFSYKSPYNIYLLFEESLLIDCPDVRWDINFSWRFSPEHMRNILAIQFELAQ